MIKKFQVEIERQALPAVETDNVVVSRYRVAITDDVTAHQVEAFGSRAGAAFELALMKWLFPVDDQ